MFRRFASALFVLIVVLSVASPAYASGGKSADTPPGGGTRIFGVVWSRGQAAAHNGAGVGNLSYH